MLRDFFGSGAAAQAFRVLSPAESVPVNPADLLARIEAAAEVLHRSGVRPDDRVMFSGDQGLPAFVAFWAVIANGAAFVPIDPSWPPPMRRKALDKTRPRCVIVEEDSALPGWIAAGIDPATVLPIDPRGALGKASVRAGFTPVTMSPEAPAACLFTSGSTGDPKAVVLSWRALSNSAALVVKSFEWQAGERLVNLPDPHTMSGLRNAFLAAPLAGVEWACAPKPLRADLFSLLDMLETLRPERLVAAPLLLRHVNLLGDRVAPEFLASAKALYCTGADLNRNEVRQFHARFGVPVINYYGLTETVGLCFSQRLQDWQAEDASIGFPVGCEVRVLDEAGLPVASGETGELQVLVPCPMSGYLDDPSATAACFDGAWLRTGDLVSRAQDGRVTITGRSATFIKTTTTEKVQPQEIEAVLEQCPGIAEAAACGLPDQAGGERIAALLVADETRSSIRPSDAWIATFVSERLGMARTPVVFRWVAVIPRNASGKILRKQLKDSFDARSST